jgi:hypothetical protein
METKKITITDDQLKKLVEIWLPVVVEGLKKKQKEG